MQLIWQQKGLNLIEKKQMNVKVFVDTNIFIYLYSNDEETRMYSIGTSSNARYA